MANDSQAIPSARSPAEAASGSQGKAGMRAYMVALGAMAAAAPASAPARAAGGGGASAVSAGQVLSTDLRELHGKGWRLADVAVEDHPDTDGEQTFAVVMAKGRAAERFRLRLGDWGRDVLALTRESIAAPDERR